MSPEDIIGLAQTKAIEARRVNEQIEMYAEALMNDVRAKGFEWTLALMEKLLTKRRIVPDGFTEDEWSAALLLGVLGIQRITLEFLSSAEDVLRRMAKESP